MLNIDERNGQALDSVIELVVNSGKPWIAVIHKNDLPLLHRPQILRDKLAKYNVPVVMGSSLQEPKGIREKLIEVMPSLLPESAQPLYADDMYTLSTTKELACEIVREKCFESLHQEIPFGLAVRILKFDEESATLTKIYAEILVAKPNHRPIVIGRDGAQLKTIGSAARLELEKLLDNKVFLDLRVSSHKNWTKNSSTLKELGYVVDSH